MADSGRLVKVEVDCTDIVDEKLPEYRKLAENGKVNDALEGLLSLEKQTRMVSDAPSSIRVLLAIVQLCFDLKEWDLLNEHVMLLTKKRSQMKTAVAAMVEECCKFVDQTPDLQTKLKLIDTLRTISEGKIYVEVPRARLTLELAKVMEKEGNLKKAAFVLQELQVETFGSMERNEKVEFILEQMRLCLATNDYIRTQIISKKINTKFFDDDAELVQALKIKYYKLMIELGQHKKDYLNICKNYQALFNTPKVQEDETRWREGLKNMVLYVLLAPFSNEQSDMLHRVKGEKKLEQIPKYREVLECFIKQELLEWSTFQSAFGALLREGLPDDPATDVFTPGSAKGDEHWEDFKKRVTEHNIRVIAQYYTRVTMSKLSTLLMLPESEVEEYISLLVTNKTIFARIDRPAGIITFRQAKNPSTVLNEWSSNLNALMSLVGKTTHLINKEEMIHTLVK